VGDMLKDCFSGFRQAGRQEGRKKGRKKEDRKKGTCQIVCQVKIKEITEMQIQTFNDPGFHQRWDINKFGVFFVVPYQEFSARGDVPIGPVINVPTILKHCHVLFLFVTSTLYKPHPT